MKTNNPELTYTALILAALIAVAAALAGRFNIVHIDEPIQLALITLGLIITALSNTAASYTLQANTRSRQR